MFNSTDASEHSTGSAAAPASRWFWLLAATGGLLVTVLIMKGRLYAASTDLSQHYELAHALAANWAWPGATPLSSSMQTYPPLSHYMGAAAGLAFGSTLTGINAVAAAAIFLCYLLLSRTLTVGSDRSTLITAAMAATGLWLARDHRMAEGFEIYSNYFYAQLVGEAVFLATALWLSNERRPWFVSWAVTAVLTYVCGSLYLIAAIEIALAYLALEGLILVRRVAAERTLRPAWLVPILAGGATLPLLVYLNPYLHFWVAVSNNDGLLDLPAAQDMVPELAAALLVVGLALGLIRPKAEFRRRQMLFLAIACCATALAALAQETVFLVTKVGSPYAVKKYGFATATLLSFGLAALAGVWLDGRRPPRPWSALAIGLPPVFALIAAVAMPPSKPDRLDRFVAYQKSVMALLRDPRTPRDALGNTMSGNDDFSPFLNYTFTMVDMGMEQPRSLTAFGLATEHTSEIYVVRKASSSDVLGPCSTKTPGFDALILVKVKCGPQIDFGSDLSQLSATPPYLVSGWGDKQPGGVWSHGPKARIAVHLGQPSGPLLMSITGDSTLPATGSSERIEVSVGGVRLTEWMYDSINRAGVRQVVIPSDLIVNGDLKLDLTFPDAVPPSSSGTPPVTAQPGLFVRSLSIESMPSLHPGDRIDIRRLFQIPLILGDGWSGKESTGVWSLGRKSTIVLPITDGDWDPVVVLEGVGFFPTPDYKQRVTARVGSTVVAQWTMDVRTPAQPFSIVVPRRLASGDEIYLTLDFPDATSPLAFHHSLDPRDLAFFITAIGLKAAPASHEAAAGTRSPS